MNVEPESLNYVGAFLGGIAISLTPCVYPLLPVTLGYIGVKSGASKVRGFLLSLTYATGLAVTYSLLGVFASLTGKLFGRVSYSPVTHIFVGLVFIVLGLSMLDIFYLSLPQSLRLPAGKNKGYLSVFFLGLSSGLVISPCVSPILGGILVYLAAKQNVFYGATLLLCFAYGMGLIFLVAGTFSSVLLSLPKSGRWMAYIKKASAIIFIGMGIYLLFTAIRRL